MSGSWERLMNFVKHAFYVKKVVESKTKIIDLAIFNEFDKIFGII